MVKYERPPLSTARARYLRRDQTDAEKKLWYLLRNRRFDGMKFRRQVPIGPYIADFACLPIKLIVEADGGQHIDNKYDVVRHCWFANEGFAVIRYSNLDILNNPEGVLSDLASRLKPLFHEASESPSPGLSSLRSPRPPSPPQGRG